METLEQYNKRRNLKGSQTRDAEGNLHKYSKGIKKRVAKKMPRTAEQQMNDFIKKYPNGSIAKHRITNN